MKTDRELYIEMVTTLISAYLQCPTRVVIQWDGKSIDIGAWAHNTAMQALEKAPPTSSQTKKPL